MKTVSTTKAPGAFGPYSQRGLTGSLVFTSGQIPIDPVTGNIVEGGIREQARQVMMNLGEVLKEAGCTYEQAGKTTCFLADIEDFAAFNEVYAEYFTGRPARSCVAVKTLPKDVHCEVEVIAALG